MELNGLGREAQDSVGLASTMKEEKKEALQSANKSVELPLAINWFLFSSLDAKDSFEMLSSLRRFSFYLVCFTLC
jgi:hypothetical protein